MKTLLLLCLICPLCISAQEIPTRGEIFDYQVGDEFHRKTNFSGHPPFGERFRVLDVDYSEDGESVTYTIHEFGYTSELDESIYPPVIWYFVNDTVQVQFDNLSAPIVIAEEIDPSEQEVYTDSVYVSSETYCDQTKVGRITTENTWEDYEVLISEFSPGLGLVYQHFSHTYGSGTVQNTFLVYVKKGDWECGEPDLLTNVEEIHPAVSILVFPNPTTTELAVDLGDIVIDGTELYAIDGTLVAHYAPSIPKPTLDIAHLPAGMYHLKVFAQGQWLSQRVVIE